MTLRNPNIAHQPARGLWRVFVAPLSACAPFGVPAAGRNKLLADGLADELLVKAVSPK